MPIPKKACSFQDTKTIFFMSHLYDFYDNVQALLWMTSYIEGRTSLL